MKQSGNDDPIGAALSITTSVGIFYPPLRFSIRLHYSVVYPILHTFFTLKMLCARRADQPHSPNRHPKFLATRRLILDVGSNCVL